VKKRAESDIRTP